MRVTEVIKDVNFLSGDALEIVQNVSGNDFVFLDPPYSSSTNRYIENYSLEKLEILLEHLNSKGAKWICTYDSINNVKLHPSLFRHKLTSGSYQSRPCLTLDYQITDCCERTVTGGRLQPPFFVCGQTGSSSHKLSLRPILGGASKKRR